jgi:hypothetical protein
MPLARALLVVIFLLGSPPSRTAGADPSTPPAFGLRPDLSLARFDPYRPSYRRQLEEDFRLSLYPREAQIVVEVDTLDGRLVYQAVGRDGSRLGMAMVDGEDDLLARTAAANAQALGKGLGDNALKGKAAGKDHIEIDIPFKVKSKTFRRIFGSGRIGLNVHGNISLRGTYRAEKRESESASAFNNNQNDFRLEQQQQFTVVGKIGEKVDVHIDQNTERSFDFENSLSIIYTGEPEEVIESISAGNISLSLPSTKYVSFSDQSSGLFGLKMVNRFGPLRVTGIASTEKNESKQQTFTGTASEKELETGPGEHVTGLFFINEFYRHQYRVYNASWDHVTITGTQIRSLDLYEFEPTVTLGIPLRLVDPAGNVLNDGSLYRMKKTSWDPSDANQPFTLDPDLGILRLNRIQEGRYIAIGYTVDNSAVLQQWFTSQGKTLAMGRLNAEEGQSVVVVFPNHFNPEAQPWWDLQLRNVFRLGTPEMDPAQFTLEIGRVVSGGRDQTSQDGTDYLSVLYLDVLDVSRNAPGNDRRVDERWVDRKTGNVWFPSPYPFGDRPEGLVLQADPGNTELGALYGPLYNGYRIAPNKSQSGSGMLDEAVTFNDAAMDTLYNLRGQYFRQNPDARWLDLNQRYRLKSTAKVGTEVISLGWNVTNVTVTANNRRLLKDTDYTLDEQAGLIRIINPAYTTADQKIQVNYETPQLFQLRKKTFAGLTAELDLWETGREKSKLGAAWIYFNEETAERKVRLGNEPIKNVVLDLNARLVFQPRFMTQWMDALPLIEADEPSQLNLEAEYAMVIPDPNPSNNPATGDDKGVAYVDDFESSKQEIPLSMGHTQWFMSARPEHELLGLRGWMGWYNPRVKVPSREIWPEYQESNREGVSNEVRVLRLEYEPFRLASQDASGADTTLAGEPLFRRHSWAGLTYDFRNAYDDFSDKKFIELTLLVEGDRGGTLNLDLGVISEDVLPNNALDTEDTDDDFLLQSSEDLGLDRMKGRDPPWPLPDELFAWSGTVEDQVAQLGAWGVTSLETIFDWWDLDGDGVRDPHEPWSYDDWIRAETGGGPVDKSHGWEGNSQDSDQIYPDTEDRNGNLTLDTANNYFSYQVPLNPAHPLYSDYVFENSRTSWVFVRIPLKDERAVTQGTPQLTLVNGIRLWLTGFNSPVRVTLAELNIVGNEWRKAVVADSDTSGYDVSVLNNYDNSDFYRSPPGVAGQKDLVTGVEAREQSLVLELQGLPYGATAWVRKQLVTTINLAEYRELKMFAHGGDLDTTAFRLHYGNGQLQYHLRLVSTENDYYEYTKTIGPGWSPANDLHIFFSEITGIDQFSGARRGREEPDKPVLLSDGGQMQVVGNPSITRVRSMLLGVTNHGAQPAWTQVWFNELRVSNVIKEISRAMRAEATAKFSDVLTLSSNFEQKDADYHTVKERAAREGSSTKRNASGSLSTNLGRLFPPSLGLNAALSINASNNLQVPKYYPNDDQLVDLDNRPQWVETYSRSRSASLSLKKTTAKGWWMQQTVDKAQLGTDISQTISRNVNTAADTATTQNARISYSNQFRWTHTLKPLAFAKEWPLLKKTAGLEIGYFPQNLSLGANTARRISHTWRRDLTQTHVETYTLSRNWSTAFKPLKTLTMNAQRSYNNNLKFRRHQARDPQTISLDNPNYPLAQDFRQRLEQWREQEASLFDGDHAISQTAGFNWTPKLVSWTTTNFGYNTTYNWSRDLVEPGRGVSLGNSGKFTADLKLEPDKLLRKFLWMSDATLNAAKKEADDRAAARLKKQQAAKKEREAKAEQKRAAREAAKAPPEPVEAEAGEDLEAGAEESPAEYPAEPSPPAPESPDPSLRPVPERMDLEPPARPSELDSLRRALEEGLFPVSGEALVDSLAVLDDGLRTPILTPTPLAGDSLFTMLPDSLLGQLAAADSLIKSTTRGNGLNGPGTPGEPKDTLKVKTPRPPSRLLLSTGRFLTGVWKRMGLAASKVEPVDIRFGRDGSRTDPGLAVYPWTPVSRRHAGLGYQLALDRDPDLDTLRISGMTFNNSRSFGYNYTLGTRVNLHKELPVRLGYDYTFSQQFANERENSRREAMAGWYDFDNDPVLGKGTLEKGDEVGGNPSLKTIPNYNLSLRRLNRVPFLGKTFKDLNLNHDYKGKLDVAYSPGAEGMYRSQLNYSRDFNPLAGFDFQLDKGWGGSASYKVGRRLKVNDPDGGNRSMSFDRTRGVTLSAQKLLKGGFQLPGFKSRFKNDTTLRLTYDNSKTLQLNSTAETGGEERRLVWNTPINKSTWSLALSTDYKFSRNVTGGGSWKYGVERSGTANDKKSYMEFQLNCRIEVRSR